MRKDWKLPDELPRLLTFEDYPGIVPEESRPFREFLRRYGAEWDEVRFEVRVGPGEDIGEGNDEALRRSWRHLTRLRLDALLVKDGTRAAIVECKRFLTNGGVWQILTYRDLYLDDHPGHQVQMALVAEGASEAALTLSIKFGVAVYLYDFGDDAPASDSPTAEGARDGVS